MAQALAQRKDLEYYLNLSYPVQLSRESDDGDEYWFAEIRQLPGCMSDGANPDEALQNLEDAKRLWIETQIEDGYEVPEPDHPDDHDGKFLLSIPKLLHHKLATQAEHEGVSLNDHIVNLLHNSYTTPPNNGAQSEPGQIQPLVRSLMKTLLEDSPSLLTQRDLRHLMDSDYCKNELGLKLGYALLRRQKDGRQGKDGRNRYYVDLYDGRYYVCSQWGRTYHCHNAASLLRFVKTLIDRQARSPDVAALEKHQAAFRDYLQKFCQDG